MTVSGEGRRWKEKKKFTPLPRLPPLGYIKMAMGVGKEGICGILKQASYPIINSTSPPPHPRPVYDYPYGNPKWATCQPSDVMVNKSHGINGALCSPPCHHELFWTACPHQKPPGTNANPECVFNLNNGAKPDHCALICKSGVDAIHCPEGAACQPFNATHGVCLF